VDGACDQFLAGARFALNQDGALHRRDEFERGEDVAHRAMASDDVVEAKAVAQLNAEFGVFLAQPTLFDPLREAARHL